MDLSSLQSRGKPSADASGKAESPWAIADATPPNAKTPKARSRQTTINDAALCRAMNVSLMKTVAPRLPAAAAAANRGRSWKLY